jgi:excinuclease ABC subunit B
MIEETVAKHERVLVLTLTKRMAEDLADFMKDRDIKAAYLHSEIDTLERPRILQKLRQGAYDVLIGINLLREGIDLPEVSRVLILDADKEGFLRNKKSMIQTSGRAARNANGYVIMYADKMTDSMQKTIDETARRRKLQHEYNLMHGLTPTPLVKANRNILNKTPNKQEYGSILEDTIANVAADPIVQYMDAGTLEKNIAHTKKQMEKAAKALDFIEAARLRDEMYALQKVLSKK